uniref:Uncharacterized protein n=1 Tax=Arundo donax TaxID=35708 RepID=A0A0A9E0Q0_ARUDO
MRQVFSSTVHNRTIVSGRHIRAIICHLRDQFTIRYTFLTGRP